MKCKIEVIKELREKVGGEFLYRLRVGIDLSKYNSNRIQNDKFGHIKNKQNKPFQLAGQNIPHKKRHKATWRKIGATHIAE